MVLVLALDLKQPLLAFLADFPVKFDKFLDLVLAALEIPEIELEASWDHPEHLLRAFLAVGFQAVN